MTPEEEKIEQAKIELDAAIKRYAHVVRPDSFSAGEWVLVYSHQSVELAREHTSSVVTVVPTDQPFWHTAGLLKVSLDSEMRPDHG